MVCWIGKRSIRVILICCDVFCLLLLNKMWDVMDGVLCWDGGWYYVVLLFQFQECLVVIVIDGMLQVVLMVMLQDLCDFVMGFVLIEGLIVSFVDVLDFEEVEVQVEGFFVCEVWLWLCFGLVVGLVEWWWLMVGLVGCGLCGVDSIVVVLFVVVLVNLDWLMLFQDVGWVMCVLFEGQILCWVMFVIYGVVFWDGVMVMVCEDVGCYNVLDKLVGVLVGFVVGQGVIVMLLCLLVDLVQKVVWIGVLVLIGVSVLIGLVLDWV